MKDHLKEITKEEYMKIKNKTLSELDDYIISMLPTSIICGYGYYGGRLLTRNDKYYIEYTIGSSCD